MSNEPQHISKNDSPVAGHVANLLLGAEIGHRSRREGFPVESREALESGAIEARREFLSELGSTTSRTSKFHRIREL